MPASARDILLLIRTKEDAQRALAGIGREMRRTQAAADAANARARAAELRRQALVMRSQGATRAQINNVLRSARAYDQQARAIENARRRTEMLHRAVTHAGEALIAMGTATAVAGGAILYGLKQAVDVAAEYDRQTRLTFTQVDKKFKPSLQELGQIGRRVAKEIALPFEQIQPALFEVFSSTDANVKQAEVLLRQFGKAAVAGQTDFQTASRATIGLMNTFGIPFSKVNHLLDIQFMLVKEGVGTYEEWATRIGLVSPSAARAGQSIETMAAALATATRMGMSAARAGTSVARAFDAISNPKTIANLEKMGVKVRDAKGHMLPMLDILKQWKVALDKLPPKDRLASLLETLKGAGSTIEARRFLQNMLMTKDGLKLFESVLGEFGGASGSFNDAYKTMANGVAAKSQLVKNKWDLLKEAIGRALLPAFSDLLDMMQRVLDKFNSLPKSTQETIAKFLLIAGIVTLVGGVLAALVGSIGLAVIALAGLSTGAWQAIGIIALVAAGIAALGAAFVEAYKKSQNFRDIINSIRDGWQQAWNIFTGFAQDVKAKYDQYLKPALDDLRDTIEKDVLPKIKEFIDYVKAEVLPKIQEAGRIIKDYLGEAFKAVGMAIRDLLIPAIKDLMTYIEQHKEQLKPWIQLLGQVVKWLLVIVGVILSAVIGAFALVIVSIAGVVKAYQGLIMILAYAGARWNDFVNLLKRFWNWLKGVDWRGAWRKLVSGSLDAISQTKAAFAAFKTYLGSIARNTVSAFLAPFRGLPGELASIARNAWQAFVASLRGGQAASSGAGHALAQAAAVAARAAVKVQSPSKVFRDIGYNVVRGFVNGINGSRKSLISAMDRLAHDVMKSLKDGKASRGLQAAWSKRMASTEKVLLSLESKRSAIAARINAQQSKLNDLLKARADLQSQIKDQLSQGAELSSLQGRSPERVLQTLQKRFTDLQDFSKNLEELKKKGLSKESIADLAQAGVEQAGGMAKALAMSTPEQIKKINSLQISIRNLASRTGTAVAGSMYDAGIKAAQGLIKGLQSQQAAITRQMTSLANALVAAIKKALGIRSPSRVFMGLGVNTAQGYLLGYQKHMEKARAMHAEMLALAPAASQARVDWGPRRGAAFGPTNPSEGRGRGKLFDINIHTQEINPRKNAAELGWELEGRLR